MASRSQIGGDVSSHAATNAEPSAAAKLTRAQIMREWAMDYMALNSLGSFPKNFDTGTAYDDGAEFCEAFGEAFPGRKPDANLTLASKRLAKLLREMWKDGLVTRGRLGNEKYLPQEPSWQYVYALFPRDCGRRKLALRDRERCLSCGSLGHDKESACLDCGTTKPWAAKACAADAGAEGDVTATGAELGPGKPNNSKDHPQ